jgi:AraC-like DNA-binding protein
LTSKDKIENRKPQLHFRIQSMGDIYDRSKGVTDVSHRHDYFTLLIINEAEGQHLIDYGDYSFGNHQVHVVSPGQVHQVILNDKPEGVVITFSKSFLINNGISLDFIYNIKLFDSFGSAAPIDFDEKIFNKLLGYIEMMKDCEKLSSIHKLRAIGSLLQLFLIEVENYISSNTNQINLESRNSCLIRDFKTLVDAEFQINHKVSFYATKLGLSSKYLSTTLKNLTGRTAKEHIKDRVLLEAKRLLLHNDISLKEIAYKIGFQEPLHFSSFFKKEMNEPPSLYRKNNKKLL